MNTATRHKIRTLRKGPLHSMYIAGADAEWEPSLERGDAGNLPTADRQVGLSAHSSADLLAPPDGQVVHIAGHKPLAHVEVRLTEIPIRVVVIHKALVAGV